MIIKLKQLFDIVGEKVSIDYQISLDELSKIREYNLVSPVHVKGEIFNRAGVVHLKFAVEFIMNIVCDRCLEEIERTYKYKFDYIVVSSTNTDNDEYIVADNESIDMNDIAISGLVLQLPTKMLCDDDCQGLCMDCGCNLNVTECDCLS